MLAIVISAFFAIVAGYSAFALVLTERTHAGAWDRLAQERQAMLARDAEARAEAEAVFPSTVTARPPVVPTGGYSYQRRFMPRSGSAPLPIGLRAAA